MKEMNTKTVSAVAVEMEVEVAATVRPVGQDKDSGKYSRPATVPGQCILDVASSADYTMRRPGRRAHPLVEMEQGLHTVV